MASIPADQPQAGQPVEAPGAEGVPLVYRHKLATRIWHGLNAVAIFVLLMSGLMIFNAHPRLYWGDYGANPDPAWLEIGVEREEGFLRVGGLQVRTTGVLGRSTDDAGQPVNRAFPDWATIPSGYDLALSRRWHLASSWLLGFGLLGFLVASLFNRHLKDDIAIRRGELAPKHVWADIVDHAKLKFAVGDAALRYSILQKLTYILVIFVLIPLMIATGLAMSPGLNAAWPWMLDVLGGRQSARSLHFIATTGLVGFIVVHLVLVVLTGPYNQIRGMITGRYRLPMAKEKR